LVARPLHRVTGLFYSSAVRRFSQILFFAVTLLGIGFAVQQHGRLPERVATHFGADGQANGWMSRDNHTIAQVGITLFVAILFFALATFLPRLPDRFVNLPQRDYWLAPKRRAETFAWLSGMLLGVGTALQAFLCWTFREVAVANLSAKPELRLNSLWLQLSLFIIVVGLVITLLSRFRKPEGAR
jgi:uncharacterized membrane protein